MIGFYDYTVVLTYISLASSITGIFCAVSGRQAWAVFFLAFSGLCDMFDGKIARAKKNRTEDQKSFGIQIDSLCDIVCFGVLPIIICYETGMNRLFGMVILVFYGIAGVIRLGYFNVMEAKRQAESGGERKYYQGLPITSMAIALPILYVVYPLFPGDGIFIGAEHVLVAVVGALFITDFKLRKPSVKGVFLITAAVALSVVMLLIIWRGCGRFLHLGR